MASSKIIQQNGLGRSEGSLLRTAAVFVALEGPPAIS